jgi:hypothetical protein
MGSFQRTGELWDERKTTRLQWAVGRAAQREMRAALQESAGNVIEAARRLGITPEWLRKRLAALDAGLDLFGLYKSHGLLQCEARTRSGRPCRSRPVSGRKRCRMHGGKSTGPRTPEGRRRVGEAARARWVAYALANGWRLPSPAARQAVAAIKRSLGGSQHGTARALNVTVHDIRRVLAGLPSRPEVRWPEDDEVS